MGPIDFICNGIDLAIAGLDKVNAGLEKINEHKINTLMKDSSFPFKFCLEESTDDRDSAFDVFNDKGNPIYVIRSEQKSTFSFSYNLTIYDLAEVRVGSLVSKPAMPSLFERRQGANFKFEIEQYGNFLGTLRNKKLGSRFDAPRKRLKDAREGLKGLRFECDFAQWEILRQSCSFEIYEESGTTLAIANRVKWQDREHYIVGYCSKDIELSCLIMVLAMALVDRYFDSLPTSNDGYVDILSDEVY